MITLNLIALILPVIVTMAGLWINCHCLDALPKHAFAETRHHVRWATVFLVLAVVQVGAFGYIGVDVVQTQYQQSMEIGK